MTSVRYGMLTRRRAVTAIAASLLTAPAITARAAAPPHPSICLRRGMNLWPWFSLTREFPPPRKDYDWPPFQLDRPVPTRGDLGALRSSGIDFVRIPVDPGPFLAISGGRHETLVRELLAAVELSNAQGLSVIVNLHPNDATHHWNSDNLVTTRTAPLFTSYIGLVRELATRLSRFDPARVCFEPLNEPPQSCTSSEWPAMQLELMRAARAAAPRLTLVACGACGAMIDGLLNLDPRQLNDSNIIYTFHFYEPYVFSHQGAPWMSTEPMYRYLNAVPWPSSMGTKEKTLTAVAARMAADHAASATEKNEIGATIRRVLDEYFAARPDKPFIARYLDRVKNWADHHGVPRERVLLGEFGALRTDERYVAASAPDRARYIRDVREACEAAGMPWAFWNLFDGMGLVADDRSRAFDVSIVAALGLRPASLQ